MGMRSLGVISSCYGEKHGTPRQGSVAPSARAHLILHNDIPADALSGLEEYSHAWLIFVFHANHNKTFHAQIRAPRLNGGKTGVLSTRSPHRVNPIGMSVAKVERVADRRVVLSGVDLIDGTPVYVLVS